VERFLKELYEIAKTEDAEGLVTYVNYPTTEYLQLPFLDFLCFDVYLEEQQRFKTYGPSRARGDGFALQGHGEFGLAGGRRRGRRPDLPVPYGLKSPSKTVSLPAGGL
jgi:hypothetical protein